MRRFTISEKANGEMAIRRMSEEAREFYDGTDPLYVYEYVDDGETFYAYKSGFGCASGLTFDELQETFEEFYRIYKEAEFDKEEFVQNLFYGAVDIKKMTIEEAENDLWRFKNKENWFIPDDFTAEEYAEIWNSLVDDYLKEE